MRSKKTPGRKKSARKTARRAAARPAARKSPARRKAAVAKRRKRAAAAEPRISPDFVPLRVAARPVPRGLGPESAGQSGDTTGLSRSYVEFESVEDLVEEGQPFEAGVVAGVVNAPDVDTAEVTTQEVPVDDVPDEYFEPVERR